MRTHRVAIVGGDGIGPEVIEAGCRVLEALADAEGDFGFAFDRLDWGSDHYRRHGAMMPADGLSQLEKADAIYFGAVGGPSLPDDLTLWGLRLAICQGFDQYANVAADPASAGDRRPSQAGAWPGDRAGEQRGRVRGRRRAGAPRLADRGRHGCRGLHRAGVERIAAYACELARSRPRRRLTIVTKSNAQRHGMVFWDEVCRDVVAGYPDLTIDWMLVDAMTQRMVLQPGTIDTVLATNLHADILSDLAAALAGSLGIGATANIDPERRRPSMFEPIHGSAFDIAGKGIANPLGSFWMPTMMLDHLGEPRGARRLMAAVETVTGRGEALSPDLGGRATTEEVTAAVRSAR